MLFTTPDASVPGMSQCSQPCVWASIVTLCPVPPTGKPASVSALISGSTLSAELTMYSMLLREVKRTWPSAWLSPMSHNRRIV